MNAKKKAILAACQEYNDKLELCFLTKASLLWDNCRVSTLYAQFKPLLTFCLGREEGILRVYRGTKAAFKWRETTNYNKFYINRREIKGKPKGGREWKMRSVLVFGIVGFDDLA